MDDGDTGDNEAAAIRFGVSAKGVWVLCTPARVNGDGAGVDSTVVG